MEKNKVKHLVIREYVISRIKSGDIPPEGRIPSENILAARFGVSRQTVRHALSVLSSEGVVKKVQGSGTFASGCFKDRSSGKKIVGIIMTYLDEYIFPEIIRGIDRELGREAYQTVLRYTGNSFEKERDSLEYFLDQDICGLIIEPSKSALPNPNIDLYLELAEKKTPIVFIHAYPQGLECSYVVENDLEAGRMAAKHLIDAGHRRIAGIFKSDDLQGMNRYRGYAAALGKAGAGIDGDRVLFYCTEDKEALFAETGWERIKNVMKGCTAAVIYNDQLALRFISMLGLEGIKVPDDLSVVSFDDSDIAGAPDISLTSVAHPKGVLGAVTAGCLLSVMKEEAGIFRKVMEPRLVIRGSVKNI